MHLGRRDTEHGGLPLICMLPLFCAKLANSIFVDLTSYKNLMISKNKILSVMNELEETGSMEPLHTATHEITFDNVDFAYVPGEPVLKHATLRCQIKSSRPLSETLAPANLLF